MSDLTGLERAGKRLVPYVLITHNAAIARRRRDHGKIVGISAQRNTLIALRPRRCARARFRSRQHTLQDLILENESMIKRASDMQADQRQQHPGKITVDVAHFMTDARADRRDRRIRQQTEELHRPAARRRIRPSQHGHDDEREVQQTMRDMRNNAKETRHGRGSGPVRESPDDSENHGCDQGCADSQMPRDQLRAAYPCECQAWSSRSRIAP